MLIHIYNLAHPNILLSMLFNFLLNGLVSGSLIAVVALGFALVYNTTRIFHIAYAGLYTLGGYLMFWFLETLGLSFLPSLVLTLGLVSFTSLLMEYLVYKPLSLRNRPHSTLMISSIGLFILLVNAILLFFGPNPWILRPDILNMPDMKIGNLSSLPLLAFFCNLVMILAFILLLKFTRLGIMIRALRDNAMMSSVFGVNTYRVRLLLFAISGLMVALAAAFRALDVGINPQVGLPVFINAFVALVIGGIGRFEGPVIGAFILGILQSLATYFIDSHWVVLVTFVILVLFILYKPEGLVPERQRAY
jgi:branched-chain amino acid transport system permease protein